MILVTGARGFIGRSVRKVLLARSLPFKLYEGDINDFERLRNELADVSQVIHLAGGEARGRQRFLAYVDVEGTNSLINAIRHRGASHLVVISRMHADPNAMFALLQAKGIVEQMVRESGVPYTIVRSASAYGKDDRFTNAIASMAAWSWPFAWLPNGGTSAMQPLWVEDLANCLVQTLDERDLIGRTITIAGDERFHYKEIVQQVLAAANINRRLTYTPPLVARTLNRSFTWMWRRPPITQFSYDRFSSPEVTSLDTVSSFYGFSPARLGQHLSHLRRKGLYRRLFRR